MTEQVEVHVYKESIISACKAVSSSKGAIPKKNRGDLSLEMVIHLCGCSRPPLLSPENS